EPPLGGEVEVAAAIRPDRTRFLAFDVALEPGRVDGLDEEFLGLLDGQAGVPFPGGQDSGANVGSAGAPTVGIYHRTIGTCRGTRPCPPPEGAPCVADLRSG